MAIGNIENISVVISKSRCWEKKFFSNEIVRFIYIKKKRINHSFISSVLIVLHNDIYRIQPTVIKGKRMDPCFLKECCIPWWENTWSLSLAELVTEAFIASTKSLYLVSYVYYGWECYITIQKCMLGHFNQEQKSYFEKTQKHSSLQKKIMTQYDVCQCTIAIYREIYISKRLSSIVK